MAITAQEMGSIALGKGRSGPHAHGNIKQADQHHHTVCQPLKSDLMIVSGFHLRVKLGGSDDKYPRIPPNLAPDPMFFSILWGRGDGRKRITTVYWSATKIVFWAKLIKSLTIPALLIYDFLSTPIR